MYRRKDRKTQPLFPELFPFGGELRESNRGWLRIAELIPWEELEEQYTKHFSDVGRPGTDAQLVIGLLLLKHVTGLSDEGIVEEVLENPYMQAFCGFEKFVTEEILDPSTLTRQREQLRQLLELNEVINTVMILKDKLKHIWSYRSRTWASKAIDEWCALARCIDYPEVNKFAKMLDKYRYGILNHCDYPPHTGTLEGVNNKIKVIKRKAYGYHDLRYFSLKIIQAFAN